MQKIVACYKWIVDDQDLRVNGSTREIDFSKATYMISPYECAAIEVAVQLAESNDTCCAALTFGDGKSANSAKDVLSRGPEEAFFVLDDSFANAADALVTANVLSSAIKRIGDVDLVICGEGSGDKYEQQVAPRIAMELGWPVVTYVSKIDMQGDKAIVHRETPEGVEVLELMLPAVVSMTGDSAVPRIPTLKQVIGAGKKSKTTWTVANLSLEDELLNPGLETTAIVGNVTDRKQSIIAGETSQAVNEAVRLLIQEGVLS